MNMWVSAPKHRALSDRISRPVARRFLLPAICIIALLFYLVNYYSTPWIVSSTGSPPSTYEPTPQPPAVPHFDEAKEHDEPQDHDEPNDHDEPKDHEEAKGHEDPSPPHCSVLKLSMLYGGHRFAELFEAIDSHRKHSQRWGCSLENLEHELTDRRHFSKQYFILSHMLAEMAKPEDQRKKWIMWVDADSIVINPAVSPEAFLPPENLDGVYGVFTADHNGLNDGLFYMRVHYSSVDLLTEVIDYNFAHPDEDLGWLGEQIAMERVIKKREDAARKAGHQTGIAWMPRPWFNTFQFEHGYEGEPGHHIVHFAGLAETRLGHMSSWLAELKTDAAKWEVPFEKTFYHKDIPAFWDEYAANLTHTG